MVLRTPRPPANLRDKRNGRVMTAFVPALMRWELELAEARGSLRTSNLAMTQGSPLLWPDVRRARFEGALPAGDAQLRAAGIDLRRTETQPMQI